MNSTHPFDIGYNIGLKFRNEPYATLVEAMRHLHEVVETKHYTYLEKKDVFGAFCQACQPVENRQIVEKE